MLPSAQVLAGAQCLLEASNFALSYISPNTMVDNIFTLRKPKDRSGILYMATYVGQHGFPWMVMSGIYAAKGNVPAEYMLASTIASKSMRRIHPSAAAPTRSAAGAPTCAPPSASPKRLKRLSMCQQAGSIALMKVGLATPFPSALGTAKRIGIAIAWYTQGGEPK